MNILVLSPHRGDAALSLGLAIQQWMACGHRVTAVGIFTRSLTAPFSDADTLHPNDVLSYVSAMRSREDAEFVKLLPGLHMIDVNLKDAPLRLRCTDDELHTIPPSPEDTAMAKINKALRRIAAEQHIDAMLIPLGLGHHVDHLVVRNAALESDVKAALAFYEDLPDALRSGTDIEASVEAELYAMRESGLATEPISSLVLRGVEEPATTKQRIVSLYPSQVDDQDITAIREIVSRYSGGERIWASQPFTDAMGRDKSDEA